MQKLSPDGYAALELPDQWIEDVMQETEAAWIDSVIGKQAVLELGWGSGMVAKKLSASGRKILVVEGSERGFLEAGRQGIDAAYSLFENFKTTRAWDWVIASFVLEHVVDPVRLLKRCAEWSSRLVVVVGNAASWHRRLAVQMGVQPRLDTLSPRDHAVGHYRVYTLESICAALGEAGWKPMQMRGFMFKPLPNAMMQHFDERLVRAMCEVEVPPSEAANIGIVCERV